MWIFLNQVYAFGIPIHFCLIVVKDFEQTAVTILLLQKFAFTHNFILRFFSPVLNLIKHFWRKSNPELKQQEWAILNVINSLGA